MKIYIDESGTFKKSNDKDFSISCVGTLVIPDWSFPKLMKKYEKVRQSLPKNEKGEVKGKLLNEVQVARIIDLLVRNNTLFEACLIDMNVQDEAQLNEQIKILKSNHTSRLSPLGLEKNGEWIKSLLARFDLMSPQLLVQFMLTTRLLHRTIQYATAYYSQRAPKELGTFEWYIDAKSKDGVTKAESWWWETVPPFLASISKTSPAMVLPFGDYSFYDAAYGADIEKEEDEGHDLHKVFSNLIFKSEIDYGLELVDIITNTLRRALTGNLREDGWHGLPDLVIHTKEESFQFLLFHDGDTIEKHNVPYQGVYKKLRSGRKSMISPKSSKWIDEELIKEEKLARG